MTIYSDDLVKATKLFVGFSAVMFAAIDAIMGSGTVPYGLALLCCGVLLVHTAGSGQDYLRRRDTQVVACLSSNPGTPLPKISAATGLSPERVASSLQRLVADGLVVSDSGRTPPLARSYRLAR
ncbi:winged helix-turn-helix domain-containing protein [Streptomyces sp. DT195]|uniref:winged helix-turn-helix domain-containing protein n=1 Tax=Streptomyces sp. DT195 TaxID=3393419 RepID=UPI003CEA81CD